MNQSLSEKKRFWKFLKIGWCVHNSNMKSFHLGAANIQKRNMKAQNCTRAEIWLEFTHIYSMFKSSLFLAFVQLWMLIQTQ